jgi:N,N'-diacetylchitobiose non-reducing end deacetylase
MAKRYSFICAHPDDLEMFTGMFIRLAVKQGQDVEIVSMTKGEWGTMDPSLKGSKLASIRVRELEHAAQLHGVPSHKIKYLGLIDGNVTLSKAVKVLRTYFKTRKPDVLIVPEYSFSVYVHPDHLNTGKATCLLLKREFRSPRPLLFTYHSFKNNTYFPTQMRATGKAIAAHKTQVQVIVYLLPFRYLYDLMNGFFYCRRFRFMESARRVYFTKKIKISLLDRLFSAAFSLGKFVFKAWSPNDGI